MKPRGTNNCGKKEGREERRKLGLYTPKFYVVKTLFSLLFYSHMLEQGKHIINVCKYLLNKQIKTQHIKFCLVD